MPLRTVPLATPKDNAPKNAINSLSSSATNAPATAPIAAALASLVLGTACVAFKSTGSYMFSNSSALLGGAS